MKKIIILLLLFLILLVEVFALDPPIFFPASLDFSREENQWARADFTTKAISFAPITSSDLFSSDTMTIVPEYKDGKLSAHLKDIVYVSYQLYYWGNLTISLNFSGPLVNTSSEKIDYTVSVTSEKDKTTKTWNSSTENNTLMLYSHQKDTSNIAIYDSWKLAVSIDDAFKKPEGTYTATVYLEVKQV